MKKIILCLLLFLSSTISVYADDSFDSEEIIPEDYFETSISSSIEPAVSSKNIIVLDRKTLLPLYEKNSYSKVAMASTTKILTCIIALENCSLNDTVTISKKAASVSGSTLGLKENMKITINDLLYGLMLRSGNDCAIAIAEYISGSIENFSILMNQKANELGLKNSHFITPHGLDHEEHFTTAYELAILTDYALKNQKFVEIVSCKRYDISINGFSRTISNTNELLETIPGVYGVKTGFTFNAGRCLVSVCKRNNLDIIIVVLGADTKRNRTKDSINLINYIFKNYTYINVKNTLDSSFKNYLSLFNKTYSLEKTSQQPILELVPLSNYEFPLTNQDSLNLQTRIYTINRFSYNMKPETIVGKLYLYCDNILLCENNIILKNQLTRNNWKYYFKKFFSFYQV